MPRTLVFKCISFLFVSVTVKETLAVFHDYTWSEVILNTSYRRPSQRVGASTWVDSNNWLRLFGGKSTSNTSNQLNDLWKFNTEKLKWYHIPNANNSDVPQNGPTCYCAGLVYLLGGHSDKTMLDHKLWTYNSSENSWHFTDLPESMKHDTNNSHIAFWCNGNAISLLVNPNSTVFYMWRYIISTSKWKSLALTGTERLVKMLSNGSSDFHYGTWTAANGTEYIYFSPFGLSRSNNSMLLSINHSKFQLFHVVGRHLGFKVEVVHWSDQAGDYWVIGEKKPVCNSSQLLCFEQWVFNIATLKWVSVGMKEPSPIPRSDALIWEVGNLVWLYGGCVKQIDGSVVVLRDLWLGHPSKYVVPTKRDDHLPGDSLGLSMTDKLIISGLVILVVMMISVRLCYKRELNQVLSKLRRRRVPYHQLSQEGDKSSRL